MRAGLKPKTLGLAGLMAVLAMMSVAAFGAATASAKIGWWVCEELGPGHVYKNSGCTEKTGGNWELFPLKPGESRIIRTVAGKTTNGPWFLEAEVLGAVHSVECSEAKLINGTISNEEPKAGEFTGKDKGKVEFTACKNHKNCPEAPATITTLGETSELGMELKGPKVGATVDIFYPNAKKEFAVFKCAGGLPTTVTSNTGYAGEWDTNIANPAFTHTLTFPTVLTAETSGHWCGNPITEVEKWNKEKLITELNFVGAPATFCGKANAEVLNAAGTAAVAWDAK